METVEYLLKFAGYTLFTGFMITLVWFAHDLYQGARERHRLNKKMYNQQYNFIQYLLQKKDDNLKHTIKKELDKLSALPYKEVERTQVLRTEWLRKYYPADESDCEFSPDNIDLSGMAERFEVRRRVEI